MAGLVIAGPWLTMVSARIMAGRARRPAALIAARRLADNPQSAFRAISGLVLGLFITTVAIGVITTIVANRGTRRDDGATSTILSIWFDRDRSNPVAVPDNVANDVHSTPGVHTLIAIRHPGGTGPGAWEMVACSDLDEAPTLGRCEPGAEVAARPNPSPRGSSMGPDAIWPTVPLTVDDFQRLPLVSIVVTTDGSTAAVERVRTILELTYPDNRLPPLSEADSEVAFTRTLAGWQRLANVVVLATLPIAGCGLAASVAGGLSDRKRPFSLLRLSGVPLRTLRRVVVLESAVPLLVSAVVAVGVGLLAAHLFLKAQMDYTLRPPGAETYLIVLIGVGTALGIIGSTLPILERITGPDTARNE
jgi:hypothetical protein